jgi:hypothetical protein
MKNILFFSLSLLSSSLYAQNPYDWFIPEARITFIEATYMPMTIVFGSDTAGGTCTRMTWVGQGADQAAQYANAKSVFAMLIAAKVSATPIKMYGVNAGCEVRFIYLG